MARETEELEVGFGEGVLREPPQLDGVPPDAGEPDQGSANEQQEHGVGDTGHVMGTKRQRALDLLSGIKVLGRALHEDPCQGGEETATTSLQIADALASVFHELCSTHRTSGKLVTDPEHLNNVIRTAEEQLRAIRQDCSKPPADEPELIEETTREEDEDCRDQVCVETATEEVDDKQDEEEEAAGEGGQSVPGEVEGGDKRMKAREKRRRSIRLTTQRGDKGEDEQKDEGGGDGEGGDKGEEEQKDEDGGEGEGGDKGEEKQKDEDGGQRKRRKRIKTTGDKGEDGGQRRSTRLMEKKGDKGEEHKAHTGEGEDGMDVDQPTSVTQKPRVLRFAP